jgi:hypothetical protein
MALSAQRIVAAREERIPMPASPTVGAGVVQAASVAFDREHTLEKAADLTADPPACLP